MYVYVCVCVSESERERRLQSQGHVKMADRCSKFNAYSLLSCWEKKTAKQNLDTHCNMQFGIDDAFSNNAAKPIWKKTETESCPNVNKYYGKQLTDHSSVRNIKSPTSMTKMDLDIIKIMHDF